MVTLTRRLVLGGYILQITSHFFDMKKMGHPTREVEGIAIRLLEVECSSARHWLVRLLEF